MALPFQLALGNNTPTTVNTEQGRIQLSDPQYLDISGGSPGYVMMTDGAANLTWGNPSGGAGSGTVTSITAGSGIVVTPAPLIASGTVGLAIMPATTLKGNATLGAAVPTDLTVAQAMTMLGAAPLASPVFTGTPSLPIGTLGVTQAAGANDTTLATTAFVKSQNYLAANQTITLSGDLTGSGTASINAQIAANAVGTAEIANANVTYAKLQNATAARLLGNPTGGAAAPSEISLGTNLSFAGTVLNAAGALSGMTAGQIPIAASATTVTSSGNLSGDITSNATLVTTLATVNSNVGTFQGLTVNGKGLVTAAANQSYAPLASPTFTGTPSLPTGTTGVTQPAATSNTTLATTAYVKANVPVPLTMALGGTNAITLPMTAGGSYGLTHTLLRTDGTTVSPASPTGGTVGMAGNSCTIFVLGIGSEGLIDLGRANGSFGAITACLSGQVLGNIAVDGTYAGNWDAAARANLACYATENWTSAANGTRWDFITTLTGGLATASRMSVQAGLTIGAPTGGDKGAGTLNATIVHANGTVLTSDVSLKREIRPLPSCLDLVRLVEPKSYRWKELPPGSGPEGFAEKARWGFLAQDFEATPFAGVEGEGEELRGLDVGALLATLWQAVRELSGEITRLKERR